MSGHNKWSTIKHKKAKTDAAKGKIFSRMAREIMMAAKLGGADPVMNARLRLALQKAKESNMPNDNVKRAIQKGVGGGEGTNLEEISFEAYANDGVGIIIEAITDNKNRTIPNVKSILNKMGANLATSGAVSYQFKKKGLVIFSAGTDEEKVMEVAIGSGAEDVKSNDDGSVEVEMDPSVFDQVKNSFDENKLEYESATVEPVAENLVSLNLDQAKKLLKLIDRLEEDDDVQNVYGNFDIPDEVMQQIDG